MNKYHRLNINDLAHAYLTECGKWGETDSDLIIKISMHYLTTTHKDENGLFDGAKSLIARITKQYGGNK